MNGFWGPFEKSIAGLLGALFLIYFALNRFSPALFNPELKNIHDNPYIYVSSSPRKGRVVPINEYSAYLSNPSAFWGGISHYDPKKISFFAKGTDMREYPVNSYLLGYHPFSTNKLWLPLLAVSLRVKYARDSEINIDDDIWQTSIETYVKTRGDCEDHAILLADWLISLGYDAKVVVGTVKGEGHAWVVLNKDGKEYLLEATDKASRRRYPLVDLHPEYVPVVMFDRDHFWVMTTRSTGLRSMPYTKEWTLFSDFKETAF